MRINPLGLHIKVSSTDMVVFQNLAIFVCVAHVMGLVPPSPFPLSQSLHHRNTSVSEWTVSQIKDFHPPRLLSVSPLADDIEQLVYLIPNSQPRRFLHLAYDKKESLKPAAFNLVVLTISEQIKQHISIHGDGPLDRNPYNYHIPGCYSTTVTGGAGMSRIPMTYGMLEEIMSALRTLLEDQERFYEAFYDLTDEFDLVLGQGSLLREEESQPHPGTNAMI